jgi:hypothetical protein
VVAGLAGEVAGTDVVLQDQHAIAVEAADDRPPSTAILPPGAA